MAGDWQPVKVSVLLTLWCCHVKPSQCRLLPHTGRLNMEAKRGSQYRQRWFHWYQNAERCSSFDSIKPVHCQDIAGGRLNWLLFTMDNSGWGWWSSAFYELSLHCGFLIILSLGHLVLAGWLVVWAHCLSMIGCLYRCFRSLGPEWG